MSVSLLFATAFLIGLSGAVMPGPLLTVTITESLARGWRAALWLITGHSLLELALVLFLALGLSRIVRHPVALRITAVGGGAVLAGMAGGAWRTALRPPAHLLPAPAGASATDSAASAPATTRGGAFTLLLTGAAVSLLNPYWIVWWASIGVTYVLQALDEGRAGLPAFYLGHVFSDYVWYIFVGVVFATGRRWMRVSVLRAIFALCGLVLAGFAVLFLLAGLGVLPFPSQTEPRPSPSTAHRTAGDRAGNTSLRGTALVEYEQALRIRPSPELAAKCGDLARAQGDLASALDHYARAIAWENRSELAVLGQGERVLVAIGQIQEQRGADAAARDAYLEALRVGEERHFAFPEGTAVFEDLARVADRAGDGATAAEWRERAAEAERG